MIWFEPELKINREPDVEVIIDPSPASIGARECRAPAWSRAELPMADTSYFREKAEQCLRLARESTDSMSANSLTELAQEYTAQASFMLASATAQAALVG